MSAAVMIGRSVFVCSVLRQFVAFWMWCRAGECERVNMAGAGEVKFLNAFVPSVLVVCFLSGFSIVSILACSHTDSKASGLLCPRVLTALQMAP